MTREKKLILKKSWFIFFTIIIVVLFSGISLISSIAQSYNCLITQKNSINIQNIPITNRFFMNKMEELDCTITLLPQSINYISTQIQEQYISKSNTIQIQFPKFQRSVLYVGGTGGNNYTYIQDAINASSNGDTIIVYAGTYFEKQIIINKALNIQGAGWATTIIDGSDATLTSCGLIRITASGNVIFGGFTLKNAGGPTNSGDYNDNLTNVGIYAQSSISGVTYYISNNKILGTNVPDDYEDYGFYTNSGLEQLIFTNNIVTQTAANALLIEKHIGITEISNNTLDAGCWGIDPIYCMTYSGTDITSMQKICYNVIDVGTGINPHGSTDNKITGIGFSSAYLGCTGIQDSGKYTNIEISNNIINNLQAYERGIALDNFAWGDGSGGEISNAIIKGNILNGVSTSQISFGIRLSGLVSDTIIQDNQINNCDMSFWGRTGYYGSSTAYPIGTNINYNNFEDNGGGLVWEGTILLNAENNWWGDASGPKHSGNPGGLGDPISGNVDYFPWLLYPFGPPYAEFDYIITGKTVTFNASQSGDYDGIIVNYEWNFGDGTLGIGKVTTHIYTADGTYNVTLKVTDDDGKNESISKSIVIINHAPNKPESPSGETFGKTGTQYKYSTKTTDIDGDQYLWYWFNWGDGTNSGWIGPFEQNEIAFASHSWTNKGTYDITVKAKDISGAESAWSTALRVSMPRSKIVNHQLLLRFLELYPGLKIVLKQLINI